MQALTGNHSTKKQESKSESPNVITITEQFNTSMYNSLLKSKFVNLLGFDLFMKQPFSERINFKMGIFMWLL